MSKYRMGRFTLAGAMLVLLAGAAHAEDNLATDPATLAKTLTEMGYKPGKTETIDGIPYFEADVDGTPTVFTFGGCSKLQLTCTYIVLTSSYSDVVEPPSEWLTKKNLDLDLVKLYTRDDKTLGFNHGFSTIGLSRVGLKTVLENWTSSANAIATDALSSKLIKN